MLGVSDCRLTRLRMTTHKPERPAALGCQVEFPHFFKLGVLDDCQYLLIGKSHAHEQGSSERPRRKDDIQKNMGKAQAKFGDLEHDAKDSLK
jgi:hypothetical protein